MKAERRVIFNDAGLPVELRYYEDEVLTARLGIIVDSDNNFIGLRDLDTELVSPQSWVDKVRKSLFNKPQKKIDVTTIDFIGLINWINTIKTIKTIENVDLIKAITNIANLQSVDLIDRITLIDTISAITNIANINSVDLIDAITNIVNINSVDLIDRITLIDTISAITNIGTITTLTGITNPINIKTSGGTNIVLDALTQGAYTERRSTLSNQGTTGVWTVMDGAQRSGKFFPRGARGFIGTIEVKCKDNGVAGGTITLYLSPNIGTGVVLSATVTVPAEGAEAWRSATFNIMWNYDPLFISAWSSSADMYFRADNEASPDEFYSADAGATWVPRSYRDWFLVNMVGETCGDVPVSGIVNNIEIPNTTTGGAGAVVTVPTVTETSLIIITGAGKVERIHLISSHDAIVFRFYVDGVMLDTYALLAEYTFSASNLNINGLTASTPQIQLLKFASAGQCFISLQVPFGFKRSFEVRAYHALAGDRYASAGVVVNKIS